MNWSQLNLRFKRPVIKPLPPTPKNGRGKTVPCANNCGREIYRTPKQLTENELHFCCRSCSSKHKFRRKKPKTYVPTSIEITLKEVLDEMGLRHETQKALCGKMHVDEFLPDHNLVIEAQGKFWHGSKTAKARDKRRRYILNKNGFFVLEIFEDDFANKKIVEAKIKNKIMDINSDLF